MKIEINIEKRNIYFLSVFILILMVGVAYAAWDTTKKVWHSAYDVNVTIGDTDYSLQEAIDEDLIGGGGESFEGFKLLAASEDWTEEAIIKITSNGINIETDYEYDTQRVVPVLYNWPTEVSKIIFEVKNSADDFCIGGGGSLSINSGIGTNAKCTDYQYKGTTLTKTNNEEGDWIRLKINNEENNNCPSQISEESFNSGYPGRFVHPYYWGYCLYEVTGWNEGSSSLEIQEADWGPDFGSWEWRIWYK